MKNNQKEDTEFEISKRILAKSLLVLDNSQYAVQKVAQQNSKFEKINEDLKEYEIFQKYGSRMLQGMSSLKGTLVNALTLYWRPELPENSILDPENEKKKVDSVIPMNIKSQYSGIVEIIQIVESNLKNQITKSTFFSIFLDYFLNFF